MKYTDNEIIRALTIISVNDVIHTFEGEPIRILCEDTLSLINRLKAEVERLALSEREAYNQLEKGNARMNAIIEAEIKEFADELRKDRVSNDPVVIAVNAELNMRGSRQ